jgi:hypothetical protein
VFPHELEKLTYDEISHIYKEELAEKLRDMKKNRGI